MVAQLQSLEMVKLRHQMQESKQFVEKQNGFTFLEILLVLSIMMILTAVILPFSEKRLQRVTEEDALKLFITTVHEAQLYAITHNERVALTFSNEGQNYRTELENLTVLFNGEFPSGMARSKGSPLKRLDFAQTGYLMQTGKITLNTSSKGVISISFQFERGRMIVNE